MHTRFLHLSLALASFTALPVLATGCGLFDKDKDDDDDDDDDDDGPSSRQLRSMRAEVQSNMKAIKTTQMAFDAEFSRYLSVHSFQPDSSPGKRPRDFSTGTAFDTLGWQPDGQVRGSYKVVTTSTTDFIVYGITDIDGDGVKSSWTCTKTINVTMNTPNDVY